MAGAAAGVAAGAVSLGASVLAGVRFGAPRTWAVLLGRFGLGLAGRLCASGLAASSLRGLALRACLPSPGQPSRARPWSYPACWLRPWARSRPGLPRLLSRCLAVSLRPSGPRSPASGRRSFGRLGALFRRARQSLAVAASALLALRIDAICVRLGSLTRLGLWLGFGLVRAYSGLASGLAGSGVAVCSRRPWRSSCSTAAPGFSGLPSLGVLGRSGYRSRRWKSDRS